MRILLPLLIINLVIGPAFADRDIRNRDLPSYETTSKAQYLKYPAYEQVIFIEGLYDSFRFFIARGAAGDDLLKCLPDIETFASRFLITDLFEKTLKTADQTEPLASVLLRTFQDFCERLK